MSHYKILNLTILIICLVLSGCSSVPITAQQTIHPGDRVTLHYTCFLPSGELAASSRNDRALESHIPRSTIYFPKKNDALVTLVAGDNNGLKGLDAITTENMGMEEILPVKIAQHLPGKKVRCVIREKISVERQPGMLKKDHTLELDLVQRRPKEIKFTPEAYRTRTGKNPEVGQKFILDPFIPGMVEAISEQEVVVRFSAEVGKKIDLPFGSGVVRNDGPYWEIHVEPEIGRLVRTGSMVGEIVKKDKRTFVIDFSHPFGGESLFCDIKVKNIEEENNGGGKPI